MRSRHTGKIQPFVLALLIFCTACGPRSKPITPDATLQDAINRLQANDSAGAVKILTEIVKREPRNGRAWRNLGLAYQRSKDVDGASRAYKEALEVEPTVPTPLFQLATIAASKHDNEEAFAWLSKAKASRKLDMTQMDAQSRIGCVEERPSIRHHAAVSKGLRRSFC